RGSPGKHTYIGTWTWAKRSRESFGFRLGEWVKSFSFTGCYSLPRPDATIFPDETAGIFDAARIPDRAAGPWNRRWAGRRTAAAGPVPVVPGTRGAAEPGDRQGGRGGGEEGEGRPHQEGAGVEGPRSPADREKEVEAADAGGLGREGGGVQRHDRPGQPAEHPQTGQQGR